MPNHGAGQVRTAIDLIREGRRDSGYRALLNFIFDSIESGVAQAAGDTADDVGSGILVRFLDERIGDAEFLDHLYQSNSPRSYAFGAALNFANSCLRGDRDYMDRKLLAPDKTDDGDEPENTFLEWADQIAGDSKGTEQSAENLLSDTEVSQEVLARRDIIERLDVDRALLLGILFIERRPLSGEQVAWLAHNSNVSENEMRSRLDARASRYSRRRLDQEQKLTRYQYDLMQLQRRAKLVQVAMRNLGDDPQGPEEPLDKALCEQLNRSLGRPLASATPGQRRAYVTYLCQRMAKNARLAQEARDVLSKALPAGPGYEEIARLLGMIHEGSSKEEIKRAKDNVNQKIHRLLIRLRADNPKGDGR